MRATNACRGTSYVPVADPARIARRNSAIRRRFVQELPPSQASVMIVIAEICNYGNNHLGCFARARTIASKCKSSRTGKPIAERHLRRITADLVLNEWLDVEHHVQREPRYRYRTYRLGRKALVFEMHEPTEPVGAGGHSGLAELVGAGGHSGQGAGGPPGPPDSGPAPKGAENIQETTTKSGPAPESSPSFLVPLEGGTPVPEVEAAPVPEATPTPVDPLTPAEIPAAEASLVIRLLAVLVITRTLAVAKIREWVRVHGLDKVHLVLTLAEHRKATRNPFRCEGGIGWVLTRWRTANMPVEAIREEVAAHEPRLKPMAASNQPVVQNLNAPAPIEPDPDPAATAAALSGGWRSWGRTAP